MDVVAKVHAQFRALETGDPELAVAAVSPGWVDHEASPEPLGVLHGPAALLAVGAWMRAAVPDLRFEEDLTVSDAGHVVSVVRFTGHQTGPFVVFRDTPSVIPPTGAALDVAQVHIHEVRDGEVVAHRAVRDDRAMLAALGVLPPDPAGLARTQEWVRSGRAQQAVEEVTARMREAAALVERATA